MQEFLFVAKAKPPDAEPPDYIRKIGEADDAGFQPVTISNIRLTEAQSKAIRREFGTKSVDVRKVEQVYADLLAHKTNAEIARKGVYKERRIAAIRATLLPTRKKGIK